ncbi:hypothetical protein I4U23_026182 [Adineta vaga]|nr:hypothetical protein I4U23_026182 [Adineta vaga]
MILCRAIAISISHIDDQAFLSICEKVLPRVQDRVNKLTVEPRSIEHVLLHYQPWITRKNTLKLKCFSLSSFNYVTLYHNRIIPLLRRMINLEELILYLTVKRCDSTHVDDVNLYNEILIYMPRLNKFMFSIDSYVAKENIMSNFSSNEDIQKSFIESRYGQVGSFVSDTRMNDAHRCHIYSIPYGFVDFIRLDNSFSGGIFHKVRYLMMQDKRPFEHQFFHFVSQCFPYLEYLHVYNDKAQKEKQNFTQLITFPYMTSLYVKAAHEEELHCTISLEEKDLSTQFVTSSN